jgi:hypothetical protein
MAGASNGGCSSSSGFPNCPWPQLPASNSSSSLTNRNSSQSQSYVTTDSQLASLSWCQSPIWAPRPDFYYCQTVAGLLMWGAISDERMGLSFTVASGLHQHSHSRVWVLWDAWLYFTVSDLRPPTWRVRSAYLYPPGTGWPSYTPSLWVPFLLPPMTCRSMVEAFEPASTQWLVDWSVGRLNCCWSSPAQLFLASVTPRSMTKIFILS